MLLLTSGDFKAYFEKYGKVMYGEVMFNRETHKSRGFGFIIFDSEAGVDRVCEQAEHFIRDKAVSVVYLSCGCERV